MIHRVRFVPNYVDGGHRAVCSCRWSACDDDLEELKRRAKTHDVDHLPELPVTLPFKSGLPEPIR